MKEKLANQITELVKNKHMLFEEFYDHVNTYMNESNLFNHPFLMHNEKSNISQEEFKSAKYILVAQFNGLGDAILTSGFMRELRSNYPDAYIMFFCDKQVQTIYERCAYVNEIFVINFESYLITDMIKEIVAFCKEKIWGKINIDLALLSHRGENNLAALLFSWLSGSRYICGYGENNWWYAYTEEENHKQEGDLSGLIYDNCILDMHATPPLNLLHDVQARYYLLKLIGCKVEKTYLECWLSEENVLRIRKKYEYIKNKRIGIGIGGTFPAKKYPIDKYIKLLQEINKIDDVTFFIIAGKDEQNDAKKITNNIANSIDCTHNTIPDTQALLTTLNLYIGNDTGSLHMATTFGYPVIEIMQEGKNRSNYYPVRFSAFHRFRPWTNNAVIIRPLHALNRCNELNIQGFCAYEHAHCITQVKVKDVLKVYQVVSETMNADIDTNEKLKKLIFTTSGLN